MNVKTEVVCTAHCGIRTIWHRVSTTENRLPLLKHELVLLWWHFSKYSYNILKNIKNFGTWKPVFLNFFLYHKSKKVHRSLVWVTKTRCTLCQALNLKFHVLRSNVSPLFFCDLILSLCHFCKIWLDHTFYKKFSLQNFVINMTKDV